MKKFVLLSFIALLLTGCSYRQIEPAQVGILFDAGSGIRQTVLRPQLVMVHFRQQLITYPTSFKNASFVKNPQEGQRREDDSIRASTGEGAQLPCDLTVSWHVDPSNVVQTFEAFGTESQFDMTEDFIRYFAVYAVNCVSGQRSIFDLMAKDRQKFGPDVKNKLAPMLAAYGITVDDVYVGEVYPASEIRDQANERIGRANDLAQALISLQRAKLDAQTIITNARRDAQLNQLRAKLANDPAALSLRKKKQKADAIAKWDGESQAVGDNTIPFTNISIH